LGIDKVSEGSSQKGKHEAVGSETGLWAWPLSQNDARVGLTLLSANSIPQYNSRVPHVSLFLRDVGFRRALAPSTPRKRRTRVSVPHELCGSL